MIEISPYAQAYLDNLDNRFASQTYKHYYGKSPYRNWQIQIYNIMNSLEQSPDKFGESLSYRTDWGDIIYNRYNVNKEVIVVIIDFNFNIRLLHNWFTSAIYPPTATVSTSRPINVNSIYFVRPYRYLTLPNGKQIYAVQSDTHLYSLADRGKRQVINYWFSSLSFPINEKIGDLNIIGYGSINNIPYYIDDRLQLHHGAEIANLERQKNENIVHHVITMIVEDLKQKRLLNEGYNLEKLGNWNVVEGSKMLGTQKGLEKWGWLSDLRLYDNNGDAIMVFNLGVGSITGGKGNKCICAKLITDKNHKFKHYKALKKEEIPQEILRDLKTKRFQ